MSGRSVLGAALAMMVAGAVGVSGQQPAPPAQQKPQPMVEEVLVPVKLKLGDPAPELLVAKWVKGLPVEQLEKGKVYVIEFWATWCAPCKESIPHMTELAKQYANQGAIFVGQNMGEDEAKVVKFVDEMGGRMDYRVALEADRSMTNSWFRAAGLNGIPCAFIVDRETRIAWIGHPLQMDKVLEDVVTGKWDIARAIERNKQEEALREKRMAIARELGQAKAQRDYRKLLDLIEKSSREDPANARAFMGLKFETQLDIEDYDGAYATAREIGEQFKDLPEALNSIAWTIVDKAGVKRRDLDLALRLATQANSATRGENASILDTLARVYFEKRDIDSAIEVQRQAVSKAPPTQKAELEATLAKYRAKKGDKPG